jgi:hypothetical protein
MSDDEPKESEIVRFAKFILTFVAYMMIIGILTFFVARKF